jgi:tryptophanyl-tRNA synthetase
VSNLLQILGSVTDRTAEDVASEFSGQGYGALKGAVADAVVEFVRPLQERYAELDADRAEVARILGVGADRAQAIAAPVMTRVREAVGLLPRGS